MAPQAGIENTNQLSQGLPEVNVNITGHDASGKEYFVSSRPAHWKAFHGNTMSFAVLYTTCESPPSLNNDEDIHKHQAIMSSGDIGLVNPGGSVCRAVDFAPGPESMMHRTRSLDFGIVVYGSVEAILESGEKRIMKAGDVCVQRGTSHAWRNTSDSEWARMIFVLQDCQPVVVNGVTLREDLGKNNDIPASQKHLSA
ncbi:hypothetical protein NA57DRAFT_31442 [Rhizodiscina lignyota]|uniref:Cupin type-2 domain-containing protein n=1 Tax=Rhizodiscina lignyota TaxID=1504668 RepID=A0A9P4INA7_9PEZI|nr:hypothetical protein NA57DRAFT_31442 [Rhizodiscina lignyota]